MFFDFFITTSKKWSRLSRGGFFVKNLYKTFVFFASYYNRKIEKSTFKN